jgi:hypothetical protein
MPASVRHNWRSVTGSGARTVGHHGVQDGERVPGDACGDRQSAWHDGGLAGSGGVAGVVEPAEIDFVVPSAAAFIPESPEPGAARVLTVWSSPSRRTAARDPRYPPAPGKTGASAPSSGQRAHRRTGSEPAGHRKSIRGHLSNSGQPESCRGTRTRGPGPTTGTSRTTATQADPGATITPCRI